MKMKRVISALLSAALAMSMAVGLSGCGGSKSNNLVWYMIGSAPADLEQVMAKANEIIEPELGVTVEMKYLDSVAYEQQMDLMLTGSEQVDVLFTGYAYPYQEKAQLGSLYDITDLAAAEGLTDGTIIPDYFIDSARINGKLYGIPNVQVVSNPGVFMADSVNVEAAGIDMQAINDAALAYEAGTGSFEAYAAALTDAFAKAKAEFPEKHSYATGYMPFSRARYEQICEGIVIRKDGSSTKFEREIDVPDYKKEIETQYSWYKNGYIKEDIAVAGNGASTPEGAKNSVVLVGTWKPGQDSNVKATKGMEGTPVYANMEAPYVARTNPLATMLGVGITSKNPEAAVKLIKLINTNTDLYNLIVFGIEGTHYNKNEEGKVVKIADSGYDMSGMAWALGNQFNAYVLEDQDIAVWEDTAAMNDAATPSPMLGFVPDLSNIGPELANLDSVRTEFYSRTDYCVDDPANWWDEYVAKLEAAGIDKVLNELQTQYDAFLASK